MARPLIGITSDIEYRDGNPGRDFYFLDAANIPAIEEAGGVAVMLPHAPRLIEEYLDRLDGVWISGGGFQFPHPRLLDWSALEGQPPEKAARARFELALVQAVEARRLPLLGVCGGFQVMNVAAGGAIVPSLKGRKPEWVLHREAAIYDEVAHDVLIEPGTRLREIVESDRIPVNSRHSQGAVEPGPRARAAAWSPDGVLEAIERPDQPFWLGVQWHPEFHISEADRRIIQAFVRAAAERGR